MTYHFRSVICPYCNHKFITLLGADYNTKTYFDFALNDYVYATICPECGREMILSPNIIEGIIPNEDRYEIRAERGI